MHLIHSYSGNFGQRSSPRIVETRHDTPYPLEDRFKDVTFCDKVTDGIYQVYEDGSSGISCQKQSQGANLKRAPDHIFKGFFDLGKRKTSGYTELDSVTSKTRISNDDHVIDQGYNDIEMETIKGVNKIETEDNEIISTNQGYFVSKNHYGSNWQSLKRAQTLDETNANYYTTTNNEIKSPGQKASSISDEFLTIYGKTKTTEFGEDNAIKTSRDKPGSEFDNYNSVSSDTEIESKENMNSNRYETVDMDSYEVTQDSSKSIKVQEIDYNENDINFNFIAVEDKQNYDSNIKPSLISPNIKTPGDTAMKPLDYSRSNHDSTITETAKSTSMISKLGKPSTQQVEKPNVKEYQNVQDVQDSAEFEEFMEDEENEEDE